MVAGNAGVEAASLLGCRTLVAPYLVQQVAPSAGQTVRGALATRRTNLEMKCSRGVSKEASGVESSTHPVRDRILGERGGKAAERPGLKKEGTSVINRQGAGGFDVRVLLVLLRLSLFRCNSRADA